MFDRKIRPMSDVYVGLVCTRRRLMQYSTKEEAGSTGGLDDHGRYRDQLTANAQTQDEIAAIEKAVWFYTFHYAYFSSNQAFGYQAQVKDDPYGSNPSLAEVRSKRSRTHYEDVERGGEYDAYIGMSNREFEGLVGAWRVGKVLDIAASKKDQYYGGPSDTVDRITVNVDVEWKDWRQLRRDFGRGDIGKRIPGASVWEEEGEIPADANHWGIGQFPKDEGVVMKWPTEYASANKSRQGLYTPLLNLDNVPIDPMTIDEAARLFESGHRKGVAKERLMAQGAINEHILLRKREDQYDEYIRYKPSFNAERLGMSASLIVPEPKRYGLGGASAAIAVWDLLQRAQVLAPAPGGASNSVADVVMAPAAGAAKGKGKGKAPVIGASAAAAAPPPPAATVADVVGKAPVPPPSMAAASEPGAPPVAAVSTLLAAGAAVTVVGKSPVPSPSMAAANKPAVVASAQALSDQRPRRTGNADVFASIFGSNAAATTSAADADVEPSPSERGSDGNVGMRGRVRRNRDGR